MLHTSWRTKTKQCFVTVCYNFEKVKDEVKMINELNIILSHTYTHSHTLINTFNVTCKKLVTTLFTNYAHIIIYTTYSR